MFDMESFLMRQAGRRNIRSGAFCIIDVIVSLSRMYCG